MFVKIENTGCCENAGKIQIRFAMFLDTSDYGYDKFRVEVYERELTETELKDKTLAILVPKVWQTNPFHNHFVYVDPTLTNMEILDLGETLLKEAYTKWQNDSMIDLKNEPFIPVKKAEIELIACEVKLKELKAVNLERRV